MIYDKIKKTINTLSTEGISEDRKDILKPLVDYLSANKENKEPVSLNFICTHNSRRSHLAQIWAQTMAYAYGTYNVQCYSGGTETTVIYPMVVETLRSNGFEISPLTQDENTIYDISLGEDLDPIIAFSKTFDDPYNPKENFAAIMTCSSADEGCPFIIGAEARIPITYNDPKISDGTNHEKETYMDRSLEIATEMKWVFEEI